MQVLWTTLICLKTSLEVVYWRTKVFPYTYVFWCSHWTLLLRIILFNDPNIILFFTSLSVTDMCHRDCGRLCTHLILSPLLLLHSVSPSTHTANLGSTHKVWVLLRCFHYGSLHFTWNCTNVGKPKSTGRYKSCLLPSFAAGKLRQKVLKIVTL